MSEATKPSPETNEAIFIEKLQKEQQQQHTSAPHKSILSNAQNISIVHSSADENKICDNQNNEVESISINAKHSGNAKLLTNSTGPPAKTITNKSMAYVSNDETIKKFTRGEVIIDKENPFKKSNGKLNKNPSPPIKQTTLTERPAHILKTKVFKEDPESITTEEVLKQSKYVKTYIKNPDKYFEFDPMVLSRIKFEELKKLSEIKPSKKVKLSQHTQERFNELSKKCTPSAKALIIPKFKKVSKPNYPELSDIKVKVGTDLEDSLFNPDEVTKNAKKFDECVRNLCIGFDDELEDIDEILTKSNSSKDINLNRINRIVNSDEDDSIPRVNGEVKSFTNTVNSQEFREFLKRKGLLLTHKRETLKPNCVKPNNKILDPSPVQFVIEKQFPTEKVYSDPPPVMLTLKKTKKPSVFYRLLPNGIFSSKRKTTPTEQVPLPQIVYGISTAPGKNESINTSTAIKRVMLKQKSFHGNVGNVLNSDGEEEMVHSRKSYASGDDGSSSVSSALITPFLLKNEKISQLVSERTHIKNNWCPSSSKERLHTFQSRDGLVKAHIQRDQIPMSNKCFARNSVERQQVQELEKMLLRQSVAERQSLVPRRLTSYEADKSLIFEPSSSMDRQEIFKKSISRINNSLPKLKSMSTKPKGLTPKNSKLNFLNGGPKLTSTPFKEHLEGQTPSANVAKPSVSPSNEPPQSEALKAIQLEQQEWVKLKEIKERTDRELYNKVIQHAENRMAHASRISVKGQSHDPENIYERLPNTQNQVKQSMLYQPLYAQLAPVNKQSFIRGIALRNTFSGVYQNRNTKIIERNTVVPNVRQVKHLLRIRNAQNELETGCELRCRNVFDEMRTNNEHEKEYRSDSETAAVIRSKNHSTPRTGTLSREEILQKVKEFCRKSINKTSKKFGSLGQVSHEDFNGKFSNNVSPVSNPSVETHNRSSSKISTPQVPQRNQRLSVQQLTPVAIPTPTISPIYAHVIKRNSVQSTVPDQSESQQRRASLSVDYYQPRLLVAKSSETDSGVFGRPHTASPPRFVIMEGEKVTPAHLMKYDQYGQVQMPSPYGYIQINSQQHSRPSMDGRVTPVILEQGNQFGPQIYWSPTRTIEHSPRLPIHLSPRYALQAQRYLSRPQNLAAFAAHPTPNLQDQQHVNVVYVKEQEQLYSLMNMHRDYTDANQLQQRYFKISQSIPQLPLQSTIRSDIYESESCSEADIQRIMETQRTHFQI